MGLKLAAVGGVVVLVMAVLFVSGCLTGDGDSAGGTGAILRRGPVSTATPPANLPDPILLGETQAGTSTTPTTGTGGTYVVKSGDTLNAIATSLGIPNEAQTAWVADVLRLNGIDDVRLLKVGQELTLPRTPAAAASPTGTPGAGASPTATRPAGQATTAPTSPPAATATKPPATPTTAAGASGRTYTVKAGDNPVTIGMALNVPAASLAAWANELVALNGVSPTGLAVGQVLQLPASTP